MPDLEKPWYSVAFSKLLLEDVPWVIGISPVALSRDVLTLEKRLATEGESFLTKTLPTFAKSLDLALQGDSPLAVSGFKKRNRRSALPAFLQALLERIFEDDGWLKDNPCIKSIRLVRQILLWCKKIQKGYDDESLRKAINDLVSVDSSLPHVDVDVHARLLGPAAGLVTRILRHMPKLAQAYPKHGPGAVAGCSDPVKKRRLDVSYADLERVFRPIPWFRTLREASWDPTSVTGRARATHGLSKVAFVEKDSSGPRVIGLEPPEYMWCQQALKELLYTWLESGPHIARGRVNFTDQSINQAYTARWAEFDTLDMSKASDRVSLELVDILFKRTSIYQALRASRTPGTVLPDGRVLWYKKFAPMGSAVCFPVEAIVFYALAVASLAKAGIPMSLAARKVFVYGDDLVVPHGYFPQLRKDFESVGLKFNESKCCIHGKFRESCGVDAYDGCNVTPIRMRKVYCDGRDPLTLISVIRHANNLMLAGYRSASLAFREAALKRYPLLKRMNLPISNRKKLPILYWYDDVEVPTLRIWYRDFIPYTKGWTFVPERTKSGARYEMRHYHESLTRGSPVGELIRLSKGQRVRTLSLRFRGELRFRRLIVEPCER